MKNTNRNIWLASIGLAFTLITTASGQQPATPTPAVPANTLPKSERLILVSLEDRKLALLENGQVKKVYDVAVGKPSTPSPEGTFTIERRVKNPVYRHDGKTVMPGPGNPVGTRWMGLSIRGYGIHGTNEPKSIGKASSHGCIRMSKSDLEEFYEFVEVGDKVELVGHRNEETATYFGPAPIPGSTDTSVTAQTAKADANSTLETKAQSPAMPGGTR